MFFPLISIAFSSIIDENMREQEKAVLILLLLCLQKINFQCFFCVLGKLYERIKNISYCRMQMNRIKVSSIFNFLLILHSRFSSFIYFIHLFFACLHTYYIGGVGGVLFAMQRYIIYRFFGCVFVHMHV
jgi:hypothetical protein